MRLIVCDTGPVLHLAEVQATHLFGLAGAVVIPPAVAQEIDFRLPGWTAGEPDWLRIEALEPDSAEQASAWHLSGLLHCGEAESIALATQIRCDWYLTDDAAARLYAASLGLEVHGTIGVILWAAAAGHCARTAAESFLEQLASESSLWMSARVLAEATAALDTICAS